MTNDYIRKQDAVSIIEKEMKNYVSDIWYKSATHSVLNDVNENIKSLEPAAVAPVKHARWRHYEGMYACEDCGAQLDDESPFCPMCGAKMDREEAS